MDPGILSIYLYNVMMFTVSTSMVFCCQNGKLKMGSHETGLAMVATTLDDRKFVRSSEHLRKAAEWDQFGKLRCGTPVKSLM